eukprot:403343438
MISDSEANERASAAMKYRSEQWIRFGGYPTFACGILSGAATYIGIGRYNLVQKVPYKIMVAFMGYQVGMNLGMKMCGDSKHEVFYTDREKAFLKYYIVDQNDKKRFQDAPDLYDKNGKPFFTEQSVKNSRQQIDTENDQENVNKEQDRIQDQRANIIDTIASLDKPEKIEQSNKNQQ